mmetsp:Transcript_16414/g.26005  ORF Transcript_16414/g.26005 Transcript_16414/m.26005 type:complete len:114 (-) Transcript_16414:39-380(-)
MFEVGVDENQDSLLTPEEQDYYRRLLNEKLDKDLKSHEKGSTKEPETGSVDKWDSSGTVEQSEDTEERLAKLNPRERRRRLDDANQVAAVADQFFPGVEVAKDWSKPNWAENW